MSLRRRLLEIGLLLVILGLQFTWLAHRYAQHRAKVMESDAPAAGQAGPQAAPEAAREDAAERVRATAFVKQRYVTGGTPLELQGVPVRIVSLVEREAPPMSGGGLRVTVLLEEPGGTRRQAELGVLAPSGDDALVNEVLDQGILYRRDTSGRFVQQGADPGGSGPREPGQGPLSGGAAPSSACRTAG